MQPRRFQALRNVALILFFLAFYYAGKWVVLATWPAQSAIPPEEASLLFTGACGVIVLLFGIGWTWSTGKDGIYRGGGLARWGFILMLVFFVGLILVTWNRI
jgi:hypothetical protein